MKPKILLIDDEKSLINMVKLKLELSYDYEVEVAYSGLEGVEKAGKAKFDIVITDYKMPDIDGAKVVDLLKQKYPVLPVLMFSIYHDDVATITQDNRARADGLVGKPIDFDKLHATITKILKKAD